MKQTQQLQNVFISFSVWWILRMFLLIFLPYYSDLPFPNTFSLLFSWTHSPVEHLCLPAPLPACSQCTVMLEIRHHRQHVCYTSFLLVSHRAPFPPRYWVRELRVLFLQWDRSGVHHSWQGGGFQGQTRARCVVCGVYTLFQSGMLSNSISCHTNHKIIKCCSIFPAGCVWACFSKHLL